MTNSNLKSVPVPARRGYLPDFCHSETLLVLILVLELIAIVLAIASATEFTSLYVHLALLSMYIQWIGLCSAALLCLITHYGFLETTFRATLLSIFVVCVLTAMMAAVAYQLNDLLRLELFRQQSLLTVILQHESVSLILYGLALRYFYVQYAAREMIKTESLARLQALQARIRPHFLFNSLNTIASLTHDEPDRAERAIESLADLFRASLSSQTQISVRDEIDLTTEYINLESLRLGDRLSVDWNIQADIDLLTMPALILQPLVENAIYHGIETSQTGGKVTIMLHEEESLKIQITNPVEINGHVQQRAGNQMAIENIRERLYLCYLGKAKFEQVTENGLYKVDIRIPIKYNN